MNRLPPHGTHPSHSSRCLNRDGRPTSDCSACRVPSSMRTLAHLWVCLPCLLLLPDQAASQGDVGLGLDCETSADCRLHAYCGPGRVCACKETYVPDKDNITCLAGLRNKCRYDDGCVPNAYCRHQERCECKEGYIPTTDLLHCKSGSSRNTWLPILLLVTSLCSST